MPVIIIGVIYLGIRGQRIPNKGEISENMKPFARIPSRIKLIVYAMVIIILFLLTGIMNHSHDNHDLGKTLKSHYQLFS